MSVVMHSLRLAPSGVAPAAVVEVQSIDGLLAPLQARVLSEVVPEQESPHLRTIDE